MEVSEKINSDQSWRGSSLKDVYRHLGTFDLEHFPPVQVSSTSTVLYENPAGDLDSKEIPKSTSENATNWDSLYVLLPNSKQCQQSVDSAENATCQTKNHWELIKVALSVPINTVVELKEAILEYNQDFKDVWHFEALHTLLKDDFGLEFFKDLLPRIIKLALQLPDLIQAPLPFLKQNENHSISLTQQQVSCLLANAFLCTFPLRSYVKSRRPKYAEYKSFPEINFNRLFNSIGANVSMATEKLKCLLNYFRRVCPNENDCSNMPTGIVTFIRQSLKPADFPDWSTSEAILGETILHIDAAGVIEESIGLLQLDFANKYIGGGVLGFGCVQEEIRFVINPELIVAKLFTECLLPNEALFMIGCEQYNNYTGYGLSFKWAGDYIDKTPLDTSKRRQIHIVAIDALPFRDKNDQFKEQLLLRELNKAYAGFLNQYTKQAPGIATGQWGCGAFRGDPRLKALLQLMVACVCDRPLVFFTFFDTALRDDIYEIYQLLNQQNTTVGNLWHILKDFRTRSDDSEKLYDYIKDRLSKPKNNCVLS